MITENARENMRINGFRGIKLVWVSFLLGGLLLLIFSPWLVAGVGAQCLLLFCYALLSCGFIIYLARRMRKGGSGG